MQEAQISAAEWEVMRVVWAAKQSTSKEISDVLGQKKEWKPATTKTLIGRLVKKGMLQTTEHGRKYIYTPIVTEEEGVQEASQTLLAQVCSKKVGKTIGSMLESSLLSQKDIDDLERLLKEKRKTAPGEIPCTCTPGQCDCHIEGGQHS